VKKLKNIALFSFSFLFLSGVGFTLFINLDPAFGGNPTKEQEESYQHLNNYVNGKFVNEIPTEVMIFSIALSTIRDFTAEVKDRNPTGPIPVKAIDWNKIKKRK
jgi:hypothetical protein